MYHNPVMLEESIKGLNIDPDGTYVDVTFGGGGHSRAILEHLQDGRLLAFDQDKDAEQNLPDDPRVTFLNYNFRYMHNFLKLYGVLPVDGILADLGVSSWQFDQSERGFSTRFEGPLDMRMDRNSGLSAHDVINQYEEEELANMFFLYGELRQSRKIAARIVRQRHHKQIDSTTELMRLLEPMAPRGKENKFFAQIFQAIRIVVNQELDALKEMLQQSHEVLRPGGRLVVISYHSLEDRLVKNFMRSGNFKGEIVKDFYGNPLTPLVPVGKALAASEQEIAANSRARSARLRVAQKR